MSIPVDPRDVAFAGAAAQARMLAAGTVTSSELVEIYLDRIARFDRELRSYRVVFTDSARSEAAAAQARLDAGERLMVRRTMKAWEDILPPEYFVRDP